MPDVKIVEWEDKYAPDFVSLSVEWLEKYISVEPFDLEMLNDPHGSILNSGGMIFFALLAGTAVGTAAMIKLEDGVFELAKLGVTERCKGMKIGNLLMERCLSFGREQGAGKVILYTNRVLVPAIGLYRKYGFEEVPMDTDKYLESDIKMELLL